MAKTFQNPFTQTITQIGQTIVNATSFTAANGGTAPTNTVLVTTAGADGSVVKSLMISSDDSSSRTVTFWVSTDSGTTKIMLGTVVIAANSGSATIINIDVLANSIITGFSIDQSGRPILELQANARIYAGVLTAAVTSGRTLYISGYQEDF